MEVSTGGGSIGSGTGGREVGKKNNKMAKLGVGGGRRRR